MAAPPNFVMTPQPWTSSVCDCCKDSDVCIEGFCCHICSIARQWDAAEGKEDSMNGLIFCLNCCLGLGYFTNCFLRCNVARIYNIDEGSCGSCFVAGLLPACSTCQTHRELLSFGRFPGGCCANRAPAIRYAQPVYMGNAQQVQNGGGYQQLPPAHQPQPTAPSAHDAYGTTTGEPIQYNKTV